ncbi:MAG TPA: hypothetical protein VN765_05735 [Candidatus Acidoferrum sp.]|nr:hypothetical protein [Candidatus Acidoferrum sp.]
MIGDCFFYDTFPKGEHLFVVLAASVETQGWYVCVNITAKRPNCDVSCELLKGEHPALIKPVSVVNYGHARELPSGLIDRLTGAQKHPKMDEGVLRRIQIAALGQNSRMKRRFQNSIRKQLGLSN